MQLVENNHELRSEVDNIACCDNCGHVHDGAQCDANERGHKAAKFFTTERLGPKRHLTPEGFLVCEDVPIARTGVQLYRADEIGFDEADGGTRVLIDRLPEEVFRPESIASANGKPVTIDHPESGELLNPDNWSEHAVGEMQNPRRGEGIWDDTILTDVVIKDRRAIDAVNKGLAEVSCGYDCEYERTGAGRGVQRKIMINHLALVDSGRCGPRCAIQDAMPKFDRLPLRHRRQVHVHVYV